MTNCMICECKMETHRSISGLLKCPNCGFVSADVEPSKHELEMIYSEKYYKGEVYTDYLADEVFNKRNFLKKLSKIKKITGLRSRISILEIGCAYGMFLEVVKNYASYLRGIDISKSAVAHAKKRLGDSVDIDQGDYLDFPVQRDKYDLICMWDTIEHLSRPDEYIKKISYEAKDGAYLCVTTGDIGSLNAKLRGSRWRQIQPPVHLHYFSKKTIKELLNKYGFETVYFSYIGSELSIKNILYQILCLRMKKERLFEMLKKKRIMDMGVYINLHDYMYVIAQKQIKQEKDI